MTPSKYKSMLRQVEFYNDLKSLKVLCQSDEQFNKLKQYYTNSNNARRRDIMSSKNYVSEDYLGFTFPDLSTIDKMPIPTQNIDAEASNALAVGMKVRFGAMGHVHDKRTGTILQQRRGQFLIELDIYHRPDRKGNTTGTKVQMWAEPLYLVGVSNATTKA